MFNLKQKQIGRFRQLCAAIVVNVLYLSVGFIVGWSSPTLPLLREDESILGGRSITVAEESWLGSLPYLGCFASTPFYSYINQNFGRKSTGYVTVFCYFIGWSFIMTGNSIVYFYIGRLILGMGLLGTGIVGTFYIGEISQDDLRGTMGVIRGFAKQAGIITVYVMGTYLSVMNTAIVCTSFNLVFLFAFFYLPESPMFLLERGKTKETFDSYLWFRGGDTQFAEQDVAKLSTVVDSDKSRTKPSLREILSVSGTRKALIIIAVLAVTQQFGGMTVIYGYCAPIIELTGGDVPPHVASFVASSVGMAMALLSCFISNIVGRKFILICTNAAMAILLISLGVYSYLKSLGMDVSSAGLLPVLCISVYCGFAIIGPFNMFYVIQPEICRPEARGVAIMVASIFASGFSFLSTKIYPYLVTYFHIYGSFWFFTAFCLTAIVFTFFYIPETRNRPLQSILHELNDKNVVQRNAFSESSSL
ncbi:facilitated trehalose transporter Tret1-like [Periplaneta americana]|uniref:facilitated trehalose transporter Tret1-like n=1 Tax=Periplaneta americana TaxID=6978 RepID=UPI0037E7B1A8